VFWSHRRVPNVDGQGAWMWVLAAIARILVTVDCATGDRVTAGIVTPDRDSPSLRLTLTESSGGRRIALGALLADRFRRPIQVPELREEQLRDSSILVLNELNFGIRPALSRTALHDREKHGRRRGVHRPLLEALVQHELTVFQRDDQIGDSAASLRKLICTGIGREEDIRRHWDDHCRTPRTSSSSSLRQTRTDSASA
jgi:hypothetical protein